MSDEIPRRVIVYEMVPAERAILEAQGKVEAMPADVRLTRAGEFLQAARSLVADFVDDGNSAAETYLDRDYDRVIVEREDALKDRDLWKQACGVQHERAERAEKALLTLQHADSFREVTKMLRKAENEARENREQLSRCNNLLDAETRKVLELQKQLSDAQHLLMSVGKGISK